MNGHNHIHFWFDGRRVQTETRFAGGHTSREEFDLHMDGAKVVGALARWVALLQDYIAAEKGRSRGGARERER
jgi:hypothetical protein